MALRPQTKTLAPTSGKTTVPGRSVTPPPAVKPPKAAPKASPPLTPDQYASRAVNQSLAPLYTAQTGQANSQNAAIANLTKAVIAALGGAPAQIGQEYDNAIGQQTNLSNAAADSLRAANPNTQDQALLSAINAPQAQKDQLAGSDNAAFNGAAAVGQYVGGVLPMSSLQSQKLAALGLAHQQPVIEGLRGQQALSAALANQSADRAKIDAMRPDLIQKYSAAFANQQNAQVAQSQKQAYLDMAYKSLGLKQQNQTFSQGLAVTKLNTQQRQFVQRMNAQIVQFNLRQKAGQAKLALPNASLSGHLGYLVNASGAPITQNGKMVLLPGSRVVNGRVVKAGTKSKAPRLSALQVQKYKGEAETIATNAKNGFDGKDPVTGKPKHFEPLTLAQAWEEMRRHGVPETFALAVLRRIYANDVNGSVSPTLNPKAAGPVAP